MINDPQMLLEAASIRLAERRLVVFQQQAWALVESQKYIHNWHVDMIAEHLEAVTRRQITNLLINIPPGMLKSLITCVFWPAWTWALEPQTRFLFASYHRNLSTRDSMKRRTVIESEWFQANWGAKTKISTEENPTVGVALASDQNQKTNFHLTAGGYSIATSVDGYSTGEHPDIAVFDDPISVADAARKKERDNVRDWWDLAMSSRGVARDIRKVGIMQRLHEQDLSGHILANEHDWVHICLPMRYEPNRMITTPLGWRDPRSKPGELLFPSLFTEKKVAMLERKLGIDAAGQLQQRPQKQAGGKFTDDMFIQIKECRWEIVATVRAWDAGGTEDGDPSANCLMSKVATPDGYRYVVHEVNARTLEIGPRDRWIKSQAETDGREVTVVLPLDPAAAGLAQMNHWRQMLQGFSVHVANVSGSKDLRSNPLASAMSFGEVWWVEGDYLSDTMLEMMRFPKAEHDDRHDAIADAYRYLESLSMTQIKVEWIKTFNRIDDTAAWEHRGQKITRQAAQLNRFISVYLGSVDFASDESARSGIQVWDVDRETKCGLVRYAWSDRVTFDELCRKLSEVSRGVKCTNVFVIMTKAGRQLVSSIDSMVVAGVTRCEGMKERTDVADQLSLVDGLKSGRIYLPEERRDVAEHVQRDWLSWQVNDKRPPCHVVLGYHSWLYQASSFGEWAMMDAAPKNATETRLGRNEYTW